MQSSKFKVLIAPAQIPIFRLSCEWLMMRWRSSIEYAECDAHGWLQYELLGTAPRIVAAAVALLLGGSMLLDEAVVGLRGWWMMSFANIFCASERKC